MSEINLKGERLSEVAPECDLVRTRHVGMEASNRRACSSEGFTLLEITIALGVLGLILSALYGSYRAVTDSIVGMRPQTVLDQKGRFFVQQLSRQVRCCYAGRLNQVRRWVSRGNLMAADSNDYLPLFRGGAASIDGNLLEYVTSGGTRSHHDYPGCLTVVSYKHDAWRHTLLVCEDLYGRRGEANDKDWRIALDDVVEIELEYFDGEEWQTEWDSGKSGRLPGAVRLRLVVESPQGYQANLMSTIPILCRGPRDGRASAEGIPARRDRGNE